MLEAETLSWKINHNSVTNYGVGLTKLISEYPTTQWAALRMIELVRTCHWEWFISHLKYQANKWNLIYRSTARQGAWSAGATLKNNLEGQRVRSDFGSADDLLILLCGQLVPQDQIHWQAGPTRSHGAWNRIHFTDFLGLTSRKVFLFFYPWHRRRERPKWWSSSCRVSNQTKDKRYLCRKTSYSFILFLTTGLSWGPGSRFWNIHVTSDPVARS